MITTNLLMTLFVSDLSAFSLQHFVPGTIVLINPAIPKAVNLVIFFTILYFLLRKPTREFFTNRYNEIRVAIDQAAKEKSEAEAKMKELDARMSRLDADIADIKTQAQREAEAERERITAAAQAETEKFRVMAKREIEAAKQNALIELRAYAAEQAVSLAEQIIRRELKPEDDARLLQRASAAMGTKQS